MLTKQTTCSKCVMDISDPLISFDEHGICNHCYSLAQKYVALDPATLAMHRYHIMEEIRKRGKDYTYDAIIGLSGGIDSSYVAYLAWKFGLQVLMIHLDNGWNTPIADQNMQAIKKITGFDLEIFKVDPAEYRDIQLAYLEASVVDIEAPTDHAILGVLYKYALKHNVKTILTGRNVNTEGVGVTSWGYRKNDLANIQNIHKKFGELPMKTFPKAGIGRLTYWRIFKRIKEIDFLNYFAYNKEKAKNILIRECGWQEYGGKHDESLWTKFYQRYILFVKFRIDKRKPELSALIGARQMTREEALEELRNSPYPVEEIERDLPKIIAKLQISRSQFNHYMGKPPVSHKAYGTDDKLRIILRLFSVLRNPTILFNQIKRFQAHRKSTR